MSVTIIANGMVSGVLDHQDQGDMSGVLDHQDEGRHVSG